MLSDPFSYIASLLFIAGVLKAVEVHSRWRLFSVLPAIVLLYFLVMVASTLGLWEKSADMSNAYKVMRNNLLPAMIFLMLLQADMRKIIQLGPRMLVAFLCAALTIGVGFIVSFSLFQSQLAADAWKTFAALCGSWMGGTGNMAAIQLALNVPDSSMGYTLLIDSIDYAMWVMFLLALVPFAGRFAAWTGADTQAIEKVSKGLTQENNHQEQDKTFSLLFLLGVALTVSAVSQYIAGWLPVSAYFTTTAWTVLLVTVFGVVGAMSPLSRLFGAVELSNLMLYLIIALIASRADFAELTQAPVYIIAGLVILAVHGSLMVLLAKLFKFDLFTMGIASLANIGGVASAPILAAAYSRALIPVGVLMAMLGYIIGTAGGLLVGRILAAIAGVQ
ncbi:DUF819 family protein [Alteromonas sediminis]|uniref:DUF819 family protein n=1 Tax=Alteromonas sediminis TaxID=2259342 RepID=A0A3N5Y0L6_9ALTE|nr:DUF819 family protein [Alteromonas sediminis]RPJ66650.1 DUF819 family protein [Alteromonas sediminis]